MSKNNRHGKAEVLTEDFRTRIKQHLPTARDRLLFAIAEYTGERWGAIIRLQVRYVYADPAKSEPHEAITFPASSRKGKRDTRQVPLHPALKIALQAYQPPSSGWLFPSKNGEQHIHFTTVDKMLRRTLRLAGLDGVGISLHSTRRSFITNLHRQGYDLHTIQQLTGHHSLSVLAGYIEPDNSFLKQAIACLP